jgi:hypothetical protein
MEVLETQSAALNPIRATQLIAKPIPIRTMMRIMSHRCIIMSLYYTKSDSTRNDLLQLPINQTKPELARPDTTKLLEWWTSGSRTFKLATQR